MAEKLEDLPIYQHALKFCSAVIDLLNKPGLRRDHRLRNQISDANDSIPANMEEGFAQSTDALFAKHLGYARGSLAEVIGRLRRARLKRYISDAEFADRDREGDALARMLTGFMRYLAESDFIEVRTRPRRRRSKLCPTTARSRISNRSRIRDMGFRMKDPGWRIPDSGLRIQDPGYGIRDSRPRARPPSLPGTALGGDPHS